MTLHPSPLRYPGGKTSLAPFLTEVVRVNGLDGGIYIEPYAGGAGAALKLLFAEMVSEIYINDLDKQIYSFWKAILAHTDDFIELIQHTPVSVSQWRRQKNILRNPEKHSLLEIGFATFFVNRCNRSGVLNGGPIGGLDQSGDYKIDVRFNKEELQRRIEKIALYRDRITVKNLDGIVFLSWLFNKRALDPKVCLVYMDPPYFEKASSLYDVYFRDSNHRELAKYLEKRNSFRWVVSYDDVSPIRNLYNDRLNVLSVNYSAHSARIGRELIISSSNCKLPQQFLETPTNRNTPLLAATGTRLSRHRAR